MCIRDRLTTLLIDEGGAVHRKDTLMRGQWYRTTDQRISIPVSYTHLDVYKRQA